MKIAGPIVGVLLAIMLIALLSLATLAWRYYTAEIRGVVTAEEQIQSAPSRIGRYEHFFGLCSSVQTHKASLAAQEARLEGMSEGNDRERVRSNIAGLTAQIARGVNTYNAQAGMEYTSAQFLASNLPPRLSTQGETICVQ